MDDITHTLLGAAAAHIAFSRRLGRWSIPIGGFAALVPDAEFFLTPLADPATPWEFHRHFTHSLAFIPLGGLIAALPFLVFPSCRGQRKLVIAAAMIGCATHGLLDTCTSWGTRLLWPFTDARFAWDVIAIIDPLFTIALLVGIIWSLIAKSSRPAVIGLACAMLYMGLGVWQHHRGLAAQEQIAQSHGDSIVRGRVMPTLGNMIVWRSVYEADGRLHADAIRLPPLGSASVKRGEPIPVFAESDLPQTAPQRVRGTFERFVRFADGYTAAVSKAPLVIGDMRYSARTEGFQPLWAIRIEPGNRGRQDLQVSWQSMMSGRGDALAQLWLEITRGEGFGSLK